MKKFGIKNKDKAPAEPKAPREPMKLPKPVQGFVDGVNHYKKQVITTGITVVACLLVIGAASAGASIFAGMETEASEAYVSLQNEKDNFKRSDRYFTSQDERLTGEDVNIKYIGTKVDGGRWQSDAKIFWEFIKPAFNYDRASEYNQTREHYIEILGGENNLFLAQFMTRYNIANAAMAARQNMTNPPTGELTEAELSQADAAFTCSASDSDLVVYPIGITSDGDYQYIAFVGMKKNSRRNDTILVGFTYTVEHRAGEGGSDKTYITGFSCWPPNSRDTLSNAAFNNR